MGFGRFDHQPPNQEIQHHVSGNLVGDPLRVATSKVSFHPLEDLELSQRGLNFPSTMVQTIAEHFSLLPVGGKASPLVTGDGLGVEHVSHHGAGAKATVLIVDDPKLN